MPCFRQWLLVVSLIAFAAARCLAADTAKTDASKSPAKTAAKAPAKPHKTFPAFLDAATAGPDFKFQGEYAGQPEGAEIPWGVQVIALGEGKFRMVGYPGGLPGAGWNKLLTLGYDAQLNADKTAATVSFAYEDRKILAKITGDKILIYDTEAGSDPLAALPRVERRSPTLGAKPPAALVLFDGSGTQQFRDGRMAPDGLLMEGATTKAKFANFTLHVEFRLPFMPTARGQARANSGVYCQGRYEVQVLDSFGLKGDDNECGGIYHASKPIVNMCLPPLAWQTYDIDFTAAKYQDGNKTADTRMTVRHNGVLVQDNVAVAHSTPGGAKETPEPGPIYLQNHGNPVRFRNVWIVEKM
jgi:hypothetical protein